LGVRERKREKEKTKESAETIEQEPKEPKSTFENSKTEEVAHSPDVVLEITESIGIVESGNHEEATEESIAEVVMTEPEFVMPSWGDIEETEWMYGIPTREDDKGLWAGEWADYILEWAERRKVHVLSVATFISEPPFKDLRNKVDSFKAISEVLIEKEVAEWIDKKKRQLRVYWRPLEDWADILYQWALKTGKLRLDVKSIVIQEVEEDFASLPEKDIHIVLALMVKKGQASWIDEKKGAILIST